jgi:hypothetical protein
MDQTFWELRKESSTTAILGDINHVVLTLYDALGPTI